MEIRIIFILLLLSFNGFSQKADLSVFVGGEFSKMTGLDYESFEYGLYYPKHNFSQRSWFLGLSIDQPLYKKLGIEVRTSFGQKYLNGWVDGSLFRYYLPSYFHNYNSLLINQKVFKGFGLNAGVGNDLRYILKLFGRGWNLTNHWNLIAGTTIEYKELTVGIKYVYGLEKEPPFSLSRVRAFRVSLGYKFKTFNWKSFRIGKKTKCPKL